MRLKKIDKILLVVLFIILAYGVSTVYADLTGTEGLAVDLSSAGAGMDFTIAFDPTELFGNRTWGDASTDTIVWTFNRATGTDPTITFNSGSIGLPALTLVTDLAVSQGGTGASSLNNLITLTTHTTGNYVLDIADGTGIDGTAAGEGATYTPSLDLTEVVGNVIWNDGATDASFTWTYNLNAGTDPVWTIGDNSMDLTAGVLRVGGSTVITATLTEEEVEDFVGGMLGGTETHIAVTYQDVTNDIDFVVSPSSVAGAIAEGELADSIIVSADIKDGVVTEADLNATNTPGAGEDNYVLTYNHAATNFTWAADATGGSTAWDDIGNPDAADEIDFGAYITELNVEDFRIGDGGANYVKFSGAGAITLAGTASITGDITGNASGSSGSCTGNSATVTNATLTTALTVITGTVGLTGNVANNSVLTLGAGASSLSGTSSGTNTGDGTYAKDLVATAPITVNAGTNVDNILVGADADITIAIPAATNATAGHATSAHITAIEANTTHAADNTQAHSDYLLNSGADTIAGALTINPGTLFIQEQADASADVAGQGQIWVNTATPNELWWTDDAGTDKQLGLGGAPATADISDVSVTQTELAELETIGATTISANQWAALGGIAETLTNTELNLLDGITVLSGSNTGDNTVATSGDSATAFFDAGTIEHERGGLEADLNAYNGLVAITSGATAEVSTKSELEDRISDVANFAEADGDTYTGNANFSGGDLELPQASPGVPDADGEIELDFTDGTVVIQHGSAHAELTASTDVVVGKLIKSWSATIFEPDSVNDVITIKAVNSIEFPHGVVITAVYLGIASNTTYTLTIQNFDDFDTINASNGTIDAVTYTADTTGEIIDTSPTYATIAAGQIIMASIPATDVDWIHFEIYYYEPAA